MDTKPIEYAIFDAARSTRSLGLRAASIVFVLFRREMFSLAFFLISLVAFGQRAVYLRVLAGGLAVCAATLLFYRTEIAKTIQERAVAAPAAAADR